MTREKREQAEQLSLLYDMRGRLPLPYYHLDNLRSLLDVIGVRRFLLVENSPS